MMGLFPAHLGVATFSNVKLFYSQLVRILFLKNMIVQTSINPSINPGLYGLTQLCSLQMRPFFCNEGEYRTILGFF